MALKLIYLCFLCTIEAGITVYENSKDHTTVPVDEISVDVFMLHLENNQIAAVDWFPVYPDLRFLYLDNNKLSEFPNLHNVSDITTLELDHNNISYIATERIGQLSKLEKLMLNDNWLTHIPDVSLPNLKIMYIGFNKLNTFPSMRYYLEYLTKLKYLNMGSVHLANVSFPPLPVLQSLSLFYSKSMETWPDFTHVYSLTLIDISYSKLTTLPLAKFAHMPLKTLKIPNNYITLDEVDDICIPSLQHLDLGANDFNGFPNWTNIGCSLLQLDLDYNDVNTFDDSYLDAYPELLRLDISHGDIQEFPILNRNGPRLEKFNIADHKITTLESKHLRPLKDCTEIKVNNNLLKNLPNLCNVDFSGTAMIYVGENTFHCNGYLVLSVEAAKLVEGVQFEFTDALCETPTSLAGREITGVLMSETTAPGIIEEPPPMSVFHDVDPPAGCGHPVSSVGPATSPIACAVRCTMTPSCGSYGFKDGVCALTSPNYETTEVYNGLRWYILQ
ncbi:hypothetical protein CAPTEDRAFT_202744 [Capitella teleta]|uniref:Apple domain-containing protein n=1 Tax=Capitella teleta TaxID=283909 RepID=R7T9N8_CAPTE|nr:hypothetical protein CAPTEDRAFT_202744 [Capitella teleta]|eukprot:ELT88110.1 hypothetical protein CAPTEDRAFT_202744 [Capitella teleta]